MILRFHAFSQLFLLGILIYDVGLKMWPLPALAFLQKFAQIGLSMFGVTVVLV
jgi:hypothetical protein